MSRFVAIAATVVLWACGAPAKPHAVNANDAIVTLASNVRDAQVWVDGRLVGPVGGLHAGIAIDPGHHRLELRHDDYFSRYVELDLHRAEKKQLQLEMAPILP